VSVAVDQGTNRVIGRPQIATRGAFTVREIDVLFEHLQETVRKIIEGALPSTMGDTDRVKRQTQAQEALARVIREETHRRPIVYVVISEIEH